MHAPVFKGYRGRQLAANTCTGPLSLSRPVIVPESAAPARSITSEQPLPSPSGTTENGQSRRPSCAPGGPSSAGSGRTRHGRTDPGLLGAGRAHRPGGNWRPAAGPPRTTGARLGRRRPPPPGAQRPRPAAVVGLALKKEKRKKHISDRLVALAAEAGIELRFVDKEAPLEAQGPFAAILQKVRKPGEAPPPASRRPRQASRAPLPASQPASRRGAPQRQLATRPPAPAPACSNQWVARAGVGPARSGPHRAPTTHRRCVGLSCAAQPVQPASERSSQARTPRPARRRRRRPSHAQQTGRPPSPPMRRRTPRCAFSTCPAATYPLRNRGSMVSFLDGGGWCV